MNNPQLSMDPKDLLVILKLAISQRDRAWTYQTLAGVLGLSPSQVHASVRRLMAAGLLAGKGVGGKVNRGALAEFMVHGARYAFPPALGRPCRGIPTGASSGLFDPSLLGQEDDIPMVWPSPRGEARGVSLAPLHPCVLEAIRQDPSLHEALVFFDALRAGRTRETEAAKAYFQRRLAWAS